MKIKAILFSLILLFLLDACCSENRNAEIKNAHQINKLNQMEWLLGPWANISEEGNFYETWKKNSDSVFSANSFMIVKGDTVFSEMIMLELIDDEIFYVATVRNQNEGRGVFFKLVSSAEEEYIFENKEHDFPQRIIYKNPVPDSLNARIEGTVNGVFRMEEFPMKRIK